MKILVTGGAGFIGSHLSEALLWRGDAVSVLDDLSTGSLEKLRLLEGRGGFKFIHGSVADAELIDRGVKAANLVVHLAAAPGRAAKARLEANAEGTANVLDSAARHSTPVITATTSNHSSRERDLKDREMARTLAEDRSIPVTVVRFRNVIGPRQSIGYAKVVPRFVRQALRGEELSVHGDGSQSRSFVYIDDVITGLVALIDKEGTSGKVFTFGSTERIAIVELAKRAVEVTESNSEIVFVPPPDVAEHRTLPWDSVPDISAAKQELDFETTWPLSDSLAAIASAFLGRPIVPPVKDDVIGRMLKESAALPPLPQPNPGAPEAVTEAEAATWVAGAEPAAAETEAVADAHAGDTEAEAASVDATGEEKEMAPPVAAGPPPPPPPAPLENDAPAAPEYVPPLEPMVNPVVSVIVPVYNEAPSIGESIRRIRALTEIDELIVVNDGSDDGTADELARVADLIDTLIELPENSGKGAAVKAGIERSTGEIIVVHDSDLELDPADIPRLTAPLIAGQAEVVTGNRLHDGNRNIVPPRQWIVNKGLTMFANAVYGALINDVATGSRAIKRTLWDALEIESDRFEFDSELQAKAVRAGALVAEIPIAFRPRARKQGKKVRWTDGVKAAQALLRFRLWRPRNHWKPERTTVGVAAEPFRLGATSAGQEVSPIVFPEDKKPPPLMMPPVRLEGEPEPPPFVIPLYLRGGRLAREHSHPQRWEPARDAGRETRSQGPEGS